MRFRPCIDLHNGIVKQIVGSTLRDNNSSLSESDAVTNFASELPSTHYARLYKHDDLRGGHIVMLGPGNEEAAINALNEFPGGFQVGGGVNASNAMKYIKAGASHVIVTSFVFKDGKIDFDRLDQLVAAVGKERVVLDLSCRKKPSFHNEKADDKYYVVTDRWQKFTEFEVNETNLALLSKFCDEFLVHGVDVEGLRLGIIEDLVQNLGKWSPIPVTYAGGVGSLDDFEIVKILGCSRVDLTVGSALDIFGGSLPYKSVLEWNCTNSFTENKKLYQ